MAKSQMLTSKNPNVAARVFHPRAMKMVRIVANVTTHVSAKKTKTGSESRVAKMGFSSRATGISPHPCQRFRSRPCRPRHDGLHPQIEVFLLYQQIEFHARPAPILPH